MRDWPDSIRGINGLPEDDKLAVYRTLIPERVYADYGIDRETLTVEGRPVVHIRCPKGSRAFEISVRRKAEERDPVLFLNMADTFSNRLSVLLVVINDPDSPRFGQWTGQVLSEANHHQLWIPPGFAHGFYVLSESADVVYKCTDFYAPEHEHTLRWDDPTVAIRWPLVNNQAPVLSQKDSSGLSLDEMRLRL